MKYIITGHNYTSPLLTALRYHKDYSVLSEAELNVAKVEFTTDDYIYVPDETSVPSVLEKYSSNTTPQKIKQIKNKKQCRELLQDSHSDFYFAAITLDKLPTVKIASGKKYIIKPQQGFFGIGVRAMDSTTNLARLAQELKVEIQKSGSFFSSQVFTSNDFLIEEYITGDEYTFDLFYNATGNPVITNFCHHPLSAIQDYFHLLYYTNEEIYHTYAKQVVDLFTALNKKLHIKNLPIHAEFKEKNGRLMPIELNVPRFGGFGLADLPYYGFGVNPYQHFFDSTAPDWQTIFQSHRHKYYGWVLCYNPIGLNLNEYRPDYDKLKQDLGEILHFEKLDYNVNPVFAITYIAKNSKTDFSKITQLDFRNYFTK
ncbi:MAG: ATP-grasp domain-containing protein [Patescibacteria group bacterium]|jgi:hypothetical protein